MAHITIEDSCIFYKQFVRFSITLTPFIPLSLKGEGEEN